MTPRPCQPCALSPPSVPIFLSISLSLCVSEFGSRLSVCLSVCLSVSLCTCGDSVVSVALRLDPRLRPGTPLASGREGSELESWPALHTCRCFCLNFSACPASFFMSFYDDCSSLESAEKQMQG